MQSSTEVRFYLTQEARIFASLTSMLAKVLERNERAWVSVLPENMEALRVFLWNRPGFFAHGGAGEDPELQPIYLGEENGNQAKTLFVLDAHAPEDKEMGKVALCAVLADKDSAKDSPELQALFRRFSAVAPACWVQMPGKGWEKQEGAQLFGDASGGASGGASAGSSVEPSVESSADGS